MHARGISRIEPYNEPDLDSRIQTATGFNTELWLDQLVLRSRAIQDAYADYNADTGKSLSPSVTAGAFAKTTYAGGNLGAPTVQATHRTFADAARPNPDPSWRLFDTFSYHSYCTCQVFCC